MDDFDAWELSHNAHPKAQERLTEPFYWSALNDNSPLGNDRGHDTGALYRRWRRGKRKPNPIRFLKEMMRAWEVKDADWDLLDPAILQKQTDEGWFHILTRDDMVIGLAFAQMILEGKVHPEVKGKALQAIDRQGLDVVIAARGWVDPQARKDRLAEMRSALAQDWS